VQTTSITAMTISVELSAAEAELLNDTAVRLGVRPEELARAALTEALSADKEEFRRAAKFVLEKNVDLYRRLA
jgi:antitoxin FitA